MLMKGMEFFPMERTFKRGRVFRASSHSPVILLLEIDPVLSWRSTPPFPSLCYNDPLFPLWRRDLHFLL